MTAVSVKRVDGKEKEMEERRKRGSEKLRVSERERERDFVRRSRPKEGSIPDPRIGSVNYVENSRGR